MPSKWLIVSCTSAVFTACVYGGFEFTKYLFAERHAAMLTRAAAGLVKENERRIGNGVVVTLDVGFMGTAAFSPSFLQ